MYVVRLFVDRQAMSGGKKIWVLKSSCVPLQMYWPSSGSVLSLEAENAYSQFVTYIPSSVIGRKKYHKHGVRRAPYPQRLLTISRPLSVQSPPNSSILQIMRSKILPCDFKSIGTELGIVQSYTLKGYEIPRPNCRWGRSDGDDGISFDASGLSTRRYVRTF